MKFDKILHALLPTDSTFYDLFEKDAANLMEGSLVFKSLMALDISKEDRARKIHEIENFEHLGDEITHQIHKNLGSTFITPFDREDIHELASKIDDILDSMQGASNRLVLYRIETFPPEAEKIAIMLHEAVIELHKAVYLLRNLKNVVAINESLVRINTIENAADAVFELAIARLFVECKDPIELIKMKELLVSLETATDECEDAANAIESIIVKNA
jgi:uncharacterized protein